MGIRVGQDEEHIGLDVSEHGNKAYNLGGESFQGTIGSIQHREALEPNTEPVKVNS